jgi:hypothetical protein
MYWTCTDMYHASTACTGLSKVTMAVAAQAYGVSEIVDVFGSVVYSPSQWLAEVAPILPIPAEGVVSGVYANTVEGYRIIVDSRVTRNNVQLAHSEEPNCVLILQHLRGVPILFIAACRYISAGAALTIDWRIYTQKLRLFVQPPVMDEYDSEDEEIS